MSGISWNCRGLGNPSTVRELNRIIKQKKPIFVFLMETKPTSSEFAPLLGKLGFEFSHIIDCDLSHGGRRGGLCLLWDPAMDIHIKSSSAHHIDTLVCTSPDHPHWRLTDVYGWPDEQEKYLSWQLFRDLNAEGSQDLEWLCLGDLNEILFSHEKLGGISRLQSKMNAFREAIDVCRLVDLGYFGHSFTWTNGQSGRANIQERLDRCLGNLAWTARFPSHKIEHLTRVHSNHCPIFIDWNHASIPNRSCRNSFRFEAMWLQDEHCKEVIKDAWIANQITPSPATFKWKMTRIGYILKSWEKENFGNITRQIASCYRVLEQVQADWPSSETLEREKTIELELQSLSKKEKIMWLQRSRTSWLKEGDKNTSFFHRTATGRRKRNRITRIRNSTGVWIEDPTSIEKVFTDYFRNIFTSYSTNGVNGVLEAIQPRVSVLINENLVELYTEEDVLAALNQMHPLKAPGPDGIPALFFVKFWSIVKADLIPMVLDILNNGVSPRPINHTHIVLIPKTNSPATPQDYRPISLCNVALKLVTKCIANRLKPILSSLICPSQSAFVPGRLITDNALLAFELFHAMKLNKSFRKSSFALKLDMSKAYDRIEWGFLESVLSRFGFCSPFINSIMSCVTTVSYSVLLNGSPSHNFNPTQGLRQGDPLSLYLFILCAEALSALILQAESHGSLHGARVCRNAPSISHFFFDDDSLIFGRATASEMTTVKDIIEQYSRASGQKVNYEKSEVSFSADVNRERAVSLASLGGISLVDNHGVYLGLPASLGRKKRRFLLLLKNV